LRAAAFFGIGEEAITGCLASINRAHCRPPLSEDEVRRVASSAARYRPTRAIGDVR
jgi:hypothetical protein